MLKASVEDLKPLKSEVEDLRRLKVDSHEMERLRKDNEEIHRLRNEVSRLRKENAQFAAQSKNQQSIQAVAVHQEQQPQPQPQSLPEQNDPTTEPVDPNEKWKREQAEICIRNLGVIDEAKTQWAVANNKQAGDEATLANIMPGLPNGVFPTCPSGGTYKIDVVGVPPACTIEGHSMLP